ncbi:hypothetical protein AK812_SmicGene35417 [Symbiodinium microadriaticum]|uniref:Uncharacterized protein n=1 Tax=Symbiodinium microadriaticum TaxID=2951 RepID=A0A1Q9CLH6_SYMMI|nr:hypothetical protein AK812_SmicGene35417 [Symbiodinium microadriaticum]
MWPRGSLQWVTTRGSLMPRHTVSIHLLPLPHKGRLSPSHVHHKHLILLHPDRDQQRIWQDEGGDNCESRVFAAPFFGKDVTDGVGNLVWLPGLWTRWYKQILYLYHPYSYWLLNQMMIRQWTKLALTLRLPMSWVGITTQSWQALYSAGNSLDGIDIGWLKTSLKKSSILRLRKLQARLRKAGGRREPLPRLRGGHGLPQELQDSMKDVPVGSHLVELDIQGLRLWDISSLSVPADQPMDTDDEVEGDAHQGLYGHFPTKVLGYVPGDDKKKTVRKPPQALRYESKKKKAGRRKVAAHATTAAVSSSTPKARPKAACKPPSKARGSIRESLMATPAASSNAKPPALRVAKSKAAATSKKHIAKR